MVLHAASTILMLLTWHNDDTDFIVNIVNIITLRYENKTKNFFKGSDPWGTATSQINF